MSKKVLNLRLSVEGKESVLRQIQASLTTISDDDGLADQISKLIQTALADAGFSDDLQVTCQCGQIKSRFSEGGGLNAREWMDRAKPPVAG